MKLHWARGEYRLARFTRIVGKHEGGWTLGDQDVPEEVDGCDNQEGDNVDLQQEGEH